MAKQRPSAAAPAQVAAPDPFAGDFSQQHVAPPVAARWLHRQLAALATVAAG